MNLMKRRLYLLLPQREKALEVVDVLNSMGVMKKHIHTIAKKEVNISALPEATVYQQNDTARYIEDWLRKINLAVFFLALLVFLVSLFNLSMPVLLISLLVMSGTFFGGYYFTTHVPHMHLSKFQAELKHGEIILLVDIPRWRIPPILKALKHSHPEAHTGGIGWTIEPLHI